MTPAPQGGFKAGRAEATVFNSRRQGEPVWEAGAPASAFAADQPADERRSASGAAEDAVGLVWFATHCRSPRVPPTENNSSAPRRIMSAPTDIQNNPSP